MGADSALLEYWARDIAASLYSDKSNDWSEELDQLADILNDDDLRADA